ncbi:MAG: hypothetical protein NVS9B8_14460 [Candidatus Limnocylindrales bacterium]
MTKESRRAARLARESRRIGGPNQPGTGATPSTPDGAPDAHPTSPSTAPRSTIRPTSGVGARAGRRERPRPGVTPGFLQRYRTALISVAAVAIVAVAAGYVLVGSTSAAYTCGSQFNPSPTPVVAPGSSTRLGFFEDDMGASHTVNPPQRYLFCPPASGTHYNAPGTLGPIIPRVYKPDDKVGPSNWIHNLEHGGMVILYRSDSPGATAAGLQAFRDYAAALPPSPICKEPSGQVSPVIARFNDMPHPYAALVWDRVFYLDTWDPALVTRFYLTESERLDSTGALVAPPEPQCNPASSASPGASSGASGSAATGSSGQPASGSAASPVASPAAPSAGPSASPLASPGAS